MVQVLANPGALDGKQVAVIGYLDLEFEGSHFCLHKEDAEKLILTNCLWISVPHTPEVLALNRRYVAVWGVVKVGRSGHMGMFNLSLQSVSAIHPVLDKAELQNAGKAQ